MGRVVSEMFVPIQKLWPFGDVINSQFAPENQWLEDEFCFEGRIHSQKLKAETPEN